MIIYPAIDLRGGRVVRLRQGAPEAETRYGDDPASIARRWADEGAEWLHVVNLDGALGRSGNEDVALNLRRLAEIRAAVSLPIQFGGGLRSVEDVAHALELGASRVILGTVAARQPGIVAQAIAKFGAERVAVALDARGDHVAVSGWQEKTGLTAIGLAKQMKALGVRRVIYTDIARDGMLTGLDAGAVAQLAEDAQIRIIASGGVAGLDDVRHLKAYEARGIEGVIVGQALYTGALRLASAIAEGRRVVEDGPGTSLQRQREGST
ncbi:MAG: 1-(5-phosphoribosyl)-5-[(5-phosphoribosylamino)methylideneamino]imidazole-4-carboxamide isomerase [Anaerolineae bacterium]|nr:1-(5-phosphoribosyl)-5-[(5-phosphoribosylamino)methylideneamino]imidazole-4-carboxamide isomerase [Anaerolineae bacterium]